MTHLQALALEFFTTNLLILGGTAFVAFFVVSDSLKAEKWKIYLGTLAFALLYTSLSTAFAVANEKGLSEPFVTLYIIHPIFAVLGGGAVFFKFVEAKKDKLLFVLLLVAHGAFLCYDIARSSYFSPMATDALDRNLLTLLITFIIVYPVLTFVLKKLWKSIAALSDVRWLLLCLLPIMFIALSFVLRWVFENNHDFYYLHSAVVIVVGICAFFTYYMLISSTIHARDKAMIEADLHNLNDNISLEAERMSEMTAHIEEVKILRHDMRHHALALTDMLESGKEAEAKEYLAALNKDIPPADFLPLCQNYVADAIAGRYLARAKSLGITASASLSIPKNTGIDPVDLAIILGNLLENALEACQRQTEGEKFINISATFEAGTLKIKVENSADTVAVKSGDRFISAKREGTGLGLRSVAAVAQKYGGLTQFDSSGTGFSAMALLYCPLSEEEKR